MVLEKIKVKGMHCKSCEILLKEELEEISGVKTATPDHEKERVSIEFDGSNDMVDKIKKKIMAEGYKIWLKK